MNNIGLILEGGGMRGAYTAGCLNWLLENNIEFNYGVGISSGAVTLSSFYLKNSKFLYDISVKHMSDKRNVGIIPLLKERRYVGYDYMFDTLLKEELKYSTKPIEDANIEIGLYDLELGQTEYYSIKDFDDDLRMLKASCALPIAGRIVDYNGHRFLDGGICTMIPIERSIEKKMDKHFVIVTKPAGYVRKPASSFMQKLMKFNYPKYPKLIKQYRDRHISYNNQMNIIEQGVKDNNTFLVRPSIEIPVKRFKGDPENLKKLYELGYSDMENQKEQILKFIQ